MIIVDVNALLLEVEPAKPCGPNLEYDPIFIELERSILGKPEVQYGDVITAEVPPEWKIVQRLALDLLGRSRDLRIAVHLLRANLALHGIDGLAITVALIERLLDERWDTVHPELDPDDDMDPTLRINSLAILADNTTVLKDLKDAVILNLPGLGALSLRLLEISSGELLPPAGQEKIAISSIEAALNDVDEGSLNAACTALGQSLESVLHIETILVQQVGSAQALNLGALTRALKRGRDFLQVQLTARPSAELAPIKPEQADASGSKDLKISRSVSTSEDIGNRDDVIRTLDKIIKYYQNFEPSSPVPLLLGRAKGLVKMSFQEILEDLAPDGIAQLMVIKGNQGQTSE